ncbi:hypothetical protein JNK13_06560 [bacterium]|nr:hypothetical protein [bacterium]
MVPSVLRSFLKLQDSEATGTIDRTEWIEMELGFRTALYQFTGLLGEEPYVGLTVEHTPIGYEIVLHLIQSGGSRRSPRLLAQKTLTLDAFMQEFGDHGAVLIEIARTNQYLPLDWLCIERTVEWESAAHLAQQELLPTVLRGFIFGSPDPAEIPVETRTRRKE